MIFFQHQGCRAREGLSAVSTLKMSLNPDSETLQNHSSLRMVFCGQCYRSSPCPRYNLATIPDQIQKNRTICGLVSCAPDPVFYGLVGPGLEASGLELGSNLPAVYEVHAGGVFAGVRIGGGISVWILASCCCSSLRKSAYRQTQLKSLERFMSSQRSICAVKCVMRIFRVRPANGMETE